MTGDKQTAATSDTMHAQCTREEQRTLFKMVNKQNDSWNCVVKRTKKKQHDHYTQETLLHTLCIQHATLKTWHFLKYATGWVG